jgi:hypothetical protein
MTSRWRIGDLGRFKSEKDDRPSFEVLGPSEDKSCIKIWYSRKNCPTLIPLRTFKQDCVNYWRLLQPLNHGLKPKEALVLEDNLKSLSSEFLRLDEFRGQVLYLKAFGAEAHIRSVRSDYVSLHVGDHLLILPGQFVKEISYKSRSYWDSIGFDLMGEADT